MTNVKVNIPNINATTLKCEMPDVTKSAQYRENLENVRAISAKTHALAADAVDRVSQISKECAEIVASIAAGR